LVVSSCRVTFIARAAAFLLAPPAGCARRPWRLWASWSSRAGPVPSQVRQRLGVLWLGATRRRKGAGTRPEPFRLVAVPARSPPGERLSWSIHRRARRLWGVPVARAGPPGWACARLAAPFRIPAGPAGRQGCRVIW